MNFVPTFIHFNFKSIALCHHSICFERSALDHWWNWCTILVYDWFVFIAILYKYTYMCHAPRARCVQVLSDSDVYTYTYSDTCLCFSIYGISHVRTFDDCAQVRWRVRSPAGMARASWASAAPRSTRWASRSPRSGRTSRTATPPSAWSQVPRELSFHESRATLFYCHV